MNFFPFLTIVTNTTNENVIWRKDNSKEYKMK